MENQRIEGNCKKIQTKQAIMCDFCSIRVETEEHLKSIEKESLDAEREHEERFREGDI